MSTPQVVSAVATPDWLTAVASGDTDRAILRMISTRYLGLALRIHPWRLRGYNGRSTADIPTLDGGLAYGENMREESSILQSWGSLTQRVITDLMVAHDMRWTRCDLALTILLDHELDRVDEWPRRADDKLINLSMITGNGAGGGTLYVGKRGSEQFGRIYDKGDQLGTIPPRTYWRWEVEYKRGSAVNVVDSLLSLPEPERRARWISDQVCGWFHERGITFPSFDPIDLQYPMVKYGSVVTSDQTTIKWLTEQVRPALRRLDHNGKLAAAFDALGIDGTCQMSDSDVTEAIEDHQYSMLDFMQNP